LPVHLPNSYNEIQKFIRRLTMVQSTKDHLIALIDRLPEEKQQELLRITETLAQETLSEEQAAVLALLKKLEPEGILTLPKGDLFALRTKPRAIPVRGEPVSQTIIEERR
jgi:hypothetical protein